MPLRFILAVLLAVSCTPFARAQDAAALARELVTVKGGYAEKKKQLEELRIRAYIPILLKAVGKGPAWKPGHPHWSDTEQRIAGEWRKHYADHLARIGRDTGYGWMDDALAQEYARTFSTEELAALLALYRSAAGTTLLALEREFLDFYPGEMVRSLARVMLGTEMLSAREREIMRMPETRERREFAELFESELVIHAETLRIGSRYVDATRPYIQQGALAGAADRIDALRRRLDPAALSELQSFFTSELGRKERLLVGTAVPSAVPLDEDPARAKQEEDVFYKGLAQLSMQWREWAARPVAK